jgi:hypothetical protein
MYYEEKIINGVLCNRTSPDDKWIPFTVEQLSRKVVDLKADNDSLYARNRALQS